MRLRVPDLRFGATIGVVPAWLPIVLVIALVLGAGLLRERWRISGLERLCRARGFTWHSPFVPGEQPPVAALAAHFYPRGARLWGAGIEATVDGLAVTMAEHEASPLGAKTGHWFTLVAWPVPKASSTAPDATVRTVDDWPHGGTLVRNGGYGVWKMDGTLTPSRVEAILGNLAAARRCVE